MAYSHSKKPVRSSGSYCLEKRGFALVATISVMVLLVMIALAMLSLSTLELRSQRNTSAMAEARANARLALMLAIAELQTELGPDQRVSANAGILANDASGNKPSDQGFDGSSTDVSFANAHLLGVWDAWKTWQTEPDFKATYAQRARESQFRSWLVSHPDREELKDLDFAVAGYSGEKAKLVSTGTLGSSAKDVDLVYAPLIDVERGSYAWQVFGENMKGCITRPSQVGENDTGSRVLQLSNSWASDVGALGSALGSALEGADDTPEALGKVVSIKTGEMLKDGKPYRTAFQGRFHDLTNIAVGLPVNVRHGGLKKDINTLLEQPVLPTQYGSRFQPKPLRPIEGYFDSTVYGNLSLNFQSWYRMHQYYQAYRGSAAAMDETTADQPMNAGLVKGVQLNGNKPRAHFNWDTSNLDQRGLARTPVITRLVLELGIRKKRSPHNANWTDFMLSYQPVMTVWNPYNVALKIPKLQTNIFRGSLEFKAYVNGTPINNWTQVRRSDNYHEMVRLYTMAGKNQGFRPLDFLPGEVRMFSAAPNALTAVDNLAVELYPGYEPLASGGGFDIKLPGLINLPSSSQVEIAVRVSSRRYSASGDGVGQGTNHHSGAFQFYWTSWPEVNGGQRFMEMAASPVEDGQPIYLIEDSSAGRLRFFANTANQRVQFGAYGFELKTEDQYPGVPYYGNRDIRGKNYALSNPTNQRAMYGQASDRVKAMAQYRMKVVTGAGGATSPDLTPQNRGFYGATHSVQSASGYNGQNFVPMVELALSPPTSLGGFGLFPLKPSVTSYSSSQHLWDISTNSLMGLGSSLANPLIPGSSVYHDIPDSIAGDQTTTDGLSNMLENRQMKLIRDHHDVTFLINDALFDNWFASGITRQDTAAFGNQRGIKQVFSDFANGTKNLPNPHYAWRHDQDASEAITQIVPSNDPTADAHEHVAKYLQIRGAFNVNSTSVDAWRQLFYGLKMDGMRYINPETGTISSGALKDGVVISRLGTPASLDEANDAGDDAAWRGVRYLTDDQIDRLAAECVRQVKLRGPFLNMADFVNRRLEDGELGVCGALQAALDFDEYNGNSPSTSAVDSINGRFKGSGDMITAANFGTWEDNSQLSGDQKTLPFPRAYLGSRWTAIPGYVMQADLLRRVGNQLTVRDDTFRIRVYGDAKDSQGNVIARAWAEAVITRSHDYLDAGADEEVKNYDKLSSEINRAYGRKIRMVSFRWLAEDEV
ncbi:MAG: hypothetical protein ACPG32_12990 [Akkermansiaceae bacterium]